MTFILSLPWKVSVPLVLFGALIAFMLAKIIIHACVLAFWQCVEEVGFRAHIASGYLADGVTLVLAFFLESISILLAKTWAPVEEWIWYRRMERIRGEPNYKSTAAPPEQTDPYDEALKVLGLPTTFDREELNRHYKRLMLSVHPDKGGNDWLGSRINTAKDIICKMKGWKK